MSQPVAEVLLARLQDPTVAIPIRFDNPDGRSLATLGIATLRRIITDAKSRPHNVSLNARRFPT